MINDLTFHFDHIGLVFCLSIFKGYICSWNISSHVFYCSSLLDVLHNLDFISSMREILVYVVLFASPTLDWCSSPFSQGVFFLGLLLSRPILLIFIRVFSIERRFESFPSLIKFLLLLIPPILLQILSSLSLLVQVLILSNGFCQSSRLIKLKLFLIK
jgi:hypothetical protein